MIRKIWVLSNLCVVCLTVRLKLIFRMFGPLCCSLLFFLFCIQMSSFEWSTRARHTYKWIHIFAIQYHVQYTLRDIRRCDCMRVCCIVFCCVHRVPISYPGTSIESKWNENVTRRTNAYDVKIENAIRSFVRLSDVYSAFTWINRNT